MALAARSGRARTVHGKPAHCEAAACAPREPAAGGCAREPALGDAPAREEGCCEARASPVGADRANAARTDYVPLILGGRAYDVDALGRALPHGRGGGEYRGWR